MKSRKLLSFAAAMIIFSGCQMPQKKEVAPAVAETDQQIRQSLQERFEKAIPLKANGQCSLFYYAKGKARRENFPVQLWVNPPSEIYMQGDVAFNAKGVVLGSNEEQFWFALAPKEISSYWWGEWSRQTSLSTMMINPRVVLEGMGVVKIDEKQQWTFSREDAYKVLINQEDSKVKRIYVDERDGLIRRIEYVGVEGEAVTVTELDKYITVSEAFSVPTQIKIIRRLTHVKQGTMSITLKLSSVKPADFTQQQRQFLFQRKPMAGFKHIYEVIDGKVVEQQQ